MITFPLEKLAAKPEEVMARAAQNAALRSSTPVPKDERLRLKSGEQPTSVPTGAGAVTRASKLGMKAPSTTPLPNTVPSGVGSLDRAAKIANKGGWSVPAQSKDQREATKLAKKSSGVLSAAPSTTTGLDVARRSLTGVNPPAPSRRPMTPSAI